MSIIAPVSVPGSNFPISPTLTGVCISYRNPASYYIADILSPRLPPGGQEAFEYLLVDPDASITVTDARVGPQSKPHEIETGGKMIPGVTEDFGFDGIVTLKQIKAYETMKSNGLPAIDPQASRVQTLTNRLDLAREQRISKIYQDPATYPATQVLDLSKNVQIDNYQDSDPIKLVQAAMDSTKIYRPNVMWFGRSAWTVFRSHPKIIQAVFKNLAGGGIATKEAVAELFELDKIVIGDSFIKGSNPGRKGPAQRVWGNNFGLVYLNAEAEMNDDATFSWTYQSMGRMAGSQPESNKGLWGSINVRVGESLKEVVSAPDVGFLFTNVIK